MCYFDVGIQTPTAGMWNHSPQAEPFSFWNRVLASFESLNWGDDSAVAEQKIPWYKADSSISLWSVCLVTRFCRAALLFSPNLHSGRRQRVWCAAASLCLDRDLFIHWDSDDQGNTIKRECRSSSGRRTRGMEWKIQVGNIRSSFQESDRFWFLYPPLFDESLPWGWSLWHRSLHTLVVPVNYSSCSCDNIVIRRSLIEFTVWLWPIGW